MVTEKTIVYEGCLKLGACRVFITPSSSHVGYSLVSVLYAKESTGSFASNGEVLKFYDLKQTLTKNKEAFQWANQWLQDAFGADPNLKKLEG